MSLSNLLIVTVQIRILAFVGLPFHFSSPSLGRMDKKIHSNHKNFIFFYVQTLKVFQVASPSFQVKVMLLLMGLIAPEFI